MERKRDLKHFRDLEVYRRSFEIAVKIYEITKSFPAQERFALTDQIRRASRSVCSNLAESWRKRNYPAVFRNKISDSMQEASETQCWLEFAFAFRYIDETLFYEFDDEYEEIIAMLNSMNKNSNKFCF